MKTIIIPLSNPVAAGGTITGSYPSGESRTSYMSSGATLAIGNNVYTTGFTLTLGASSFTVTNPGRAIQPGTSVILSMQTPAERAGTTVATLAETVGYVEYAGSPVGVLTPDFIGQRCQDTTTGLFYVARTTSSSGWVLQIGSSEVGTRTLYLDGDSLLARTTREDTLATFTVASNVITFTSPSPTYFAHGAECRLYGFADDRLNFTGTIINDSTSVRMAIPVTVPDGSESTYPAKSGAARAIAVSTTMMDCSPLTQAQLAAGKRWKFKKLAMGGRTSAVIAADFASQIAGLAPGVMLIESGVNTAKNGESNTDVATRYEAMVVAALAAGHQVILTTPTTFSSAASSYATYNAQYVRQAQSMRQIAQKYNVELWDLLALWVDGTSTDGQPTSGYVDASDGIHWNVAFARAAATSLNTLLDKYKVAYTPAPLLRSILDAAYLQNGSTQDASNTNKLRNGQLFGTSGTGGTIADGWTLSLTGATTTNAKAASALNASDGTQRLTIGGSSGQSGILTSTSFHGDLSAGKTVRASGKIRLNITALTRVSVGLLMTIGGRSSQQVVAMSSYNATLCNPSGDVTLDWVTPDYVVQAGAVPTNCQVFMQFVLTGTVTNQVIELSQCRGDVFDA